MKSVPEHLMCTVSLYGASVPTVRSYIAKEKRKVGPDVLQHAE